MRIGQQRSLCRVFGSTESAGTLESTVTTWAPRGEMWASFLPRFLTLRSYGAGEAPSGMREVEVHPGAAVSNRNGVEVIAGPEAGSKWRVIDIDEADQRRWVVRLESFSGDFR